MDPATTALLIRVGADLLAQVIAMWRTGGRTAEADQLEAILRRSDAHADTLIARAQAALKEG